MRWLDLTDVNLTFAFLNQFKFIIQSFLQLCSIKI